MDAPNLLFKVLFAEKARSTHHKLALDALLHLRCAQAERWRDLFLRHVEPFLTGAKAPDKTFKDFRNHVLHVREGLWGGAPKAARKWYGETVDALRREDWKAAVYNAGVLSHYYSDPLMPFHTGQTEVEKNIHRAAEWSMTKSYDRFRELLDSSLGWPEVDVPDAGEEDWLGQMVIAGAERSNLFYDELCTRYDFDAGVKSPPAGLDEVCRHEIALCVGHAAVGFARILERAIDEADARPPRVGTTLVAFLSAFSKPIFWLTKRLADSADRAQVLRIYKELTKTGTVEVNLPEDDRVVRELHRVEVLGIDGEAREMFALPAPRVQRGPETRDQRLERVDGGEQVASPAPPLVSSPSSLVSPKAPRPRLHPSDPVLDAPSIGPKTEARLTKAGVHTVADLLAVDPHDLSERLQARWIVPEVVRDWQHQARLMCRIPGVYGHDVQILVAVGVTEPSDLAALDPADLLDLTGPFLSSKAGERVLRGGDPPDLAEVTDWITWARQARELPRITAEAA